jgi:glycosyltransferase involved in cell wall biosynthesis
MKIGFDYTIADLNMAGSGVYARSLFTALQQLSADGADLEMLPLRMGSPWTQRRRTGLLRRAAVLYRSLIGRHVEMPRAVRRAGVDLFHEPNGLLPAHISTPSVVTMFDTSVLDFPHGFNAWQRIEWRVLARRSLSTARLVLTISESAKRDILRHYAVPDEKIFVTPLAAADVFRALPSQTFDAVRARFGLRRFLLTVGTLEPRKNHVGLITAFLEARRRGHLQDVQLVHVGAPTWKRPVGIDDAARYGDAVRFLGYLDIGDLVALMNAADATAFLSFGEGFGLPVLESMQCGTPVVASDIPVLREVAADAAVYADPHSTSAMADALIAVLEDADLRARMRESGLRRAQQFSWAACARRTEDAYRAAVAMAGGVAGR